MIYIMSFGLGTLWSNNNKNKNIFSRNKKHVSNTIQQKTLQILPTHQQKSTKNSNNIMLRSYWGTPTWYLFHTIAARTNEDYYNSNYEYIWNFIKKCCATLPCPFCREHAINYTKNISLSDVNTKKKLQNVLFNFHNTANTNSGSKPTNISVLEQYNNANISKIFKLFKDRFFKSYIGNRVFNDWVKNKFKKDFIKFSEKISGNFM
jgi:hypothetical protein